MGRQRIRRAAFPCQRIVDSLPKIFLVEDEEFRALSLWLMAWPTLHTNQMASEHIPPRISITNGIQLMPADQQDERLDDSFL